MEKRPKTAMEAITEATAKAGVTLHVIEPKPGTGTVTFLAKRKPPEGSEEAK
jgi:hypothetical protein